MNTLYCSDAIVTIFIYGYCDTIVVPVLTRTESLGQVNSKLSKHASCLNSVSQQHHPSLGANVIRAEDIVGYLVCLQTCLCHVTKTTPALVPQLSNFRYGVEAFHRHRDLRSSRVIIRHTAYCPGHHTNDQQHSRTRQHSLLRPSYP